MTVKKLIKLLRKQSPKALVMTELTLPEPDRDRKYHTELSDVSQETCGSGKEKFKVVWLS